MQVAISGADIQPGGQATQHTRISDAQETGRGTPSLGPTSAESKSGLQTSTRLQVSSFLASPVSVMMFVTKEKHPFYSSFTGQMLFLMSSQQCQGTEANSSTVHFNVDIT